MKELFCGAVRTHIYQLNSSPCMGEVHGAQNNYSSNIRNHRSHIAIANIIMMNKFDIL